MRTLFTRLWNASPRMIAHYLFPSFFFNRCYVNPSMHELLNDAEVARLQKVPRFTTGETTFQGKRLFMVDANSFLAMVDEIFVKRNYEFEASRKVPLIIDCGANIGLSIIFFKMLYPDCRIIAFEADQAIFRVLQQNIISFGFRNVTLHSKAVWSSDTEIDFYAEGSWGGRLAKPGDANNIVKVSTARLKDFLNQQVDFLKIDVEGAETQILQDCADRLHHVNHLFVEYHSHPGERQTLQDLLAVLQAAGFRYHIREARPFAVPFINAQNSEGMDLQLDIFAFRALRERGAG